MRITNKSENQYLIQRLNYRKIHKRSTK